MKKILTVGELKALLAAHPDETPVCFYSGDESFYFAQGIRVLVGSRDLAYDVEEGYENPLIYEGWAITLE